MSRSSRRRSKKKLSDALLESNAGCEIAAFICIVTGLFLVMSQYYPETTGRLGWWIAGLYGPWIIGKGMVFLPVYLLIVGGALVFLSYRWKQTVVSSVLSFFSLLLFLQLFSVPSLDLVVLVGDAERGGWLGSALLSMVYPIFGVNGVRLFFGLLFVISTLVLFNVSFSRTIFVLKWVIVKSVLGIHVLSRSITAQIRSLIPEKDESVDNTYQSDESVSGGMWSRLIRFVTGSKDDVADADNAQETEDDALSVLDEADAEYDADDDDGVDESEADDGDDLEPESQGGMQKLFSRKQRVVKHPSFKLKSAIYELPPLDLLMKPGKSVVNSKAQVIQRQENARILEMALASFHVDAEVVNVTPGPSVTRYELRPGEGVKVSKITSLAKDIALKLAAPDVRIEAPIPGKALVGIEVPNTAVDMVTLRTIIDRTDFYENPSKLLCALGLTITGEAILMDLAKMPHVLIAGATGSGKSVCINSIITSILLRATPDDVRFLMIDPKKVELNVYEDIPHLVAPVVTNPNKAAATLKQWALLEMERRYEEFSRVGVKNIEAYNSQIMAMVQLMQSDPEASAQQWEDWKEKSGDYASFPEEMFPKRLPYIVVVIDELADLMMVAAQDVETTICRLAQMARATGIHLVIATQRPSVNVVTGLIKANVPSRISFFLQSQIDSRTILDMPGAEKLMGKGDMLYSPVGSFQPKRAQGLYVSEDEVKAVVAHWWGQGKPQYASEILEVEALADSDSSGSSSDDASDELYEEAKQLIMSSQYASTSYLQRKLRIGYNRAARLMDELRENGVLSEHANQSKPIS